MLIEDYNSALQILKDECSTLPRSEDYNSIIADELSKDATRPFASIIMRTQGKRPEGLNEALLGLFAQSCQDFEVVLIGHKLDEMQNKIVTEIIDNQPASLRQKIRFFELGKGGRTVPLNFGFAHARGEYAIILDDDDLVFEKWIEVFKESAMRNPGKIIHTGTLKQYWSSNSTEWDINALRAELAPSNEYCNPFNIISQITTNNCPPVSLAFPLYPFREHGIIFDENLDCVEDWDYLMRAVMITGIADILTPTSIYRWWMNAESSQTICDQSMWKSSAEIVWERNKKRCYIITPSEIKTIFEQKDLQASRQFTEEEKRAALNSLGHIDMIREMYVRLFGTNGLGYRIGVKLGSRLRSNNKK